MPAIALLSPDKAFYDTEPIVGNIDAFAHEIEAYALSYAERLDRDLAGTDGVVVELGAGSCALSSAISRLASVRSITAADISSLRMASAIDKSVRALGGARNKIAAVECDFNNPLPFDDASVDAVLFDAALHHARNIWGLLAECNRILRPGGKLVAQREAYLTGIRATGQIAYLLRTPEACARVSENMYLRAQYEYYLKVNGFAVEFIPFSRSRAKRLLRPLNGILFCDGTLYCAKGH